MLWLHTVTNRWAPRKTQRGTSIKSITARKTCVFVSFSTKGLPAFWHYLAASGNKLRDLSYRLKKIYGSQSPSILFLDINKLCSEKGQFCNLLHQTENVTFPQTTHVETKISVKYLYLLYICTKVQRKQVMLNNW